MNTHRKPPSNEPSSPKPPSRRQKRISLSTRGTHPLGIEKMRELARIYGGECLSEKYAGVEGKLDWRCSEGHAWEARPEWILRGSWCPTCRIARILEERIEKLRAAAKAKGGECLSSECIGRNDSLTFRCARGHIWQARAEAILRRSWCPTCGNENRRKSLSDMQALAEKRGGKCLSTEFFGTVHKMLWQCGKGHVWEAPGNRIRNGYWCPECARLERSLTIEVMHEIAQSRGGLCLSNEYTNTLTKLNWQCAHGHTWTADPGNIKSGRWCPVCARRSHINRTIEDMQKLAHERGGRCLSKEYRGVAYKLTWQCNFGHVWETSPAVVLHGSWCPECYYLSMCLSDKARKKHLRAGSIEKTKTRRKSGLY
ncbi:MAG: hypothetical protein FWD77_05970 [Betaproteobacteria bacterium]|nr:hypothetical protein [Betaproteobacteria bacterium]